MSLSNAEELQTPWYAEAKEIIQKGRESLDQTLLEYRLKPWRILPAWQTGYSQPRLPNGDPEPGSLTQDQYDAVSLGRILELESTHQGGSRALHETTGNGIGNFGRASIDVLRHLCDNTEKPASRVVLFAMAQYCSNGALIEPYNHFEKLLADPQPETAYEAIEAGDSLSLGYLMESVVARHGPDARTHVVVLSGHQNARPGITLGQPPYEPPFFERLGAGSFKQYIAPALGKISLRDSSLIINSCWAGDGKYSFAAAANRMCRLTTIAPTEPARIESFKITDENGLLVPLVEFTTVLPDQNANTFHEKPSRHLVLPAF